MELAEEVIEAMAARFNDPGAFHVELKAGNVMKFPAVCVGTAQIMSDDGESLECFMALATICEMCPDPHYYLLPVHPAAVPYVFSGWPGIEPPASDPYTPPEEAL